MLPYRGRVLVKVKKWHKGGGLVAPFADAMILCPSHLVNGGWVVQLKDDRVLHVREAVQTNEEGEQLRIQQGPRGEVVQLHLEEDDRPGQPHRRMTGKQPLGDTPCLKGAPNTGGSILHRRQFRGRVHQLQSYGRIRRRSSQDLQQQPRPQEFVL